MSISILKNVRISGISFVIPNNLVLNVDDLLYFFDNNPKKLSRAKKIMGYGKRYISPAGLTTVDICEEAGLDLFTGMNIDRSSIDAVVFASQDIDYIKPASASILHDKLKLPKTCAAFDINQGCTGYVYGLWVASSLISSGACKRILLLSGHNAIDRGSMFNKGKKLIFSSAGSATLLEYDANASNMHFLMGSDGSGYESIIIPAGGYRMPVTHEILDKTIRDKDGQEWYLNDTFLDGLAVFDFTIDIVPSHIQTLLKETGYSADIIDFFAIHQANKQIVESIMHQLDLDESKYSTDTFCKYGNMAGVSCLSNLIDICGEKLRETNLKIALISYGIGLSWASAVMDVGNIYCSGIKFHEFKNIKSPKDLLEYWINKIENYSGGS